MNYYGKKWKDTMNFLNRSQGKEFFEKNFGKYVVGSRNFEGKKYCGILVAMYVDPNSDVCYHFLVANGNTHDSIGSFALGRYSRHICINRCNDISTVIKTAAWVDSHCTSAVEMKRQSIKDWLLEYSRYNIGMPKVRIHSAIVLIATKILIAKNIEFKRIPGIDAAVKIVDNYTKNIIKDDTNYFIYWLNSIQRYSSLGTLGCDLQLQNIKEQLIIKPPRV